ncbi:MAG: D-amino acid aminotransferase [Acidiferrobacteraceae bacterium]
MKTVYLNGRFVAEDQAFVPVFDRGFIFGDGVYEVVPVYGGRLFRLPHHLARLGASLRAIGLFDPMSAAQWAEVLDELIRRCDAKDQSLYLQVTRGPAPRDHAFPPDVKPTVFAYAQPLREIEAGVLKQGVRAVALDDIRWRRCDIKATALLANVLLRQEAVSKGASEALLIRDGVVTEGAASNIFAVINGQLTTAPKGPFILPGVTRDLILELARANGVDSAERAVSREELPAASEIWMTSSTKEILAIVELDGKPVGQGVPGPLFFQMHALFQDYKRRFRKGEVS